MGILTTGIALAALLSGTNTAAGVGACDIVWNGEFRYRLVGTNIIVKRDRFVGHASRDSLEAAATASADGDPRDIEMAMSTISHGEDCDADSAMDTYRHIFVDGAPVGFTPEDWADIRDLRNDPVYHD